MFDSSQNRMHERERERSCSLLWTHELSLSLSRKLAVFQCLSFSLPYRTYNESKMNCKQSPSSSKSSQNNKFTGHFLIIKLWHWIDWPQACVQLVVRDIGKPHKSLPSMQPTHGQGRGRGEMKRLSQRVERLPVCTGSKTPYHLDSSVSVLQGPGTHKSSVRGPPSSKLTLMHTFSPASQGPVRCETCPQTPDWGRVPTHLFEHL